MKDIQEDIKDLLALTALDLIDGRDRHFAEDLAAANPELELTRTMARGRLTLTRSASGPEKLVRTLCHTACR